MIGVDRDRGTWGRAGGRVAQPTLVVVSDGAGSQRVGTGPVRPLGAGSWFVAMPGVTYRYGPSGVADAVGWDEYRVGFRGRASERWSRWGWLPDRGACRTATDVAAARRALDDLARIVGDGAAAAADRAVVAFEGVLLELNATAERPASDDSLVNAFVAMCRDRLATPVDVPAIAAELGVSYSSLRQRVRRALGRPAGRLLAEMRADLARELLARRDLPIAEVAARTGFDDPNRFGQFFRREVGTSPSAYRRHLP